MVPIIAYICLACLFGAVSAEFANGWYSIKCNTKGGGQLGWKQHVIADWNLFDNDDNLELAPAYGGMLNENLFYLESQGNGYTKIRVIYYRQPRYIEAFPLDEKLRMKPLSSGPDAQDQTWLLQDLGNGEYLIACNTQRSGWKVVEAFGASKELKLKDYDPNQTDQRWFLTKER